jgi:hypothetical protein
MKARHHRRFFFLILFTLTTAIIGAQPWAGSEKGPYNFKPARMAMLSITMKESAFHVDMLASDEFQGREAGTSGQWLAAKYIANEFSKYGLKPAGDDNKYYQNFRIRRPDLKKAVFWLEKQSTKSKEKIELSLKSDFMPFDFTGENSITAPIAFAGYGITAPEYNYDDYENVDASGKIVLVLRHEPQENVPESPFDGLNLTQYALFSEKAKNAQAHGAVGMLLVTDPAGGHSNSAPQGFWPSLFPTSNYKGFWKLEPDQNGENFVAAWISVMTAEKIIKIAEPRETLKSLQQTIDKHLTPKSFEIADLKAHINFSLYQKVRKTQNVLGLLQGYDPALRDEVVVVGAHYDHIGIKDGHIYHGADDNASGTAGMLEIAEAFSEMPALPRRSVLFAAFSAEELGLLGSEFYVNHAVIPLTQTVAMINLDMISRNEDNSVSVIGSNRSPELHEINLAANEEIGLQFLYNGERYFSRSDQFNFAKHKIPVLFYNTDTHNDYHRPTDTFEKINPEKMAKISRLAYLVVWELANSDERPTFRRFQITN